MAQQLFYILKILRSIHLLLLLSKNVMFVRAIDNYINEYTQFGIFSNNYISDHPTI